MSLPQLSAAGHTPVAALAQRIEKRIVGETADLKYAEGQPTAGKQDPCPPRLGRDKDKEGSSVCVGARPFLPLDKDAAHEGR